MKIGSLFSGFGGLDLAAEKVFGGTTVWHAEIDPAASKVLATRWPGVPNLGDITTVDWSQVPPVDVLCGGFPCQDVSAAGRRAGIKDGTRSGLWSVMADVIAALQPRFVVIENVRGLLSATAERAVEPGEDAVGNRTGRPVLRAAGAVLGDLADLRYDAQWTTLAASDVGAPHRRERVFILATPANTGNDGRPGEANNPCGGNLTLQGAVGGTNAKDVERHLKAGRKVADEVLLPTPRGGNFGSASGAKHPNGTPNSGHTLNQEVALLPTPNAVDGGGGSATQSMESLIAGNRQANLTDIARLMELPPHLPQYNRNAVSVRAEIAALLPTPRSSDAFGAGHHGDGGLDLRTSVTLLHAQWGKYAAAIHRWEQTNGPAPSPTEPNKNSKPRLSAAFAEWMMGLPAGWVTAVNISRNNQLKCLGNGVVPQQATAALHNLLNASLDIGA